MNAEPEESESNQDDEFLLRRRRHKGPGVAITGTAEPPAPPPGVEGTPSYDPSLRTYVIFDGATGNWLKLRRTSGEWVSMDGF